jgi:phosphomannomutase
MISVSGIRGIVGEGLSPELLVNFSAAVGTFYGRGRVMVGRDSRVTGDMVKHAVFSGLMSVGCDPVELGVVPTPTTQLAVEHSDAVGGIVITASHNPVEWNALKLLSAKGLFLDEAQGAEVKKIAEARSFQYALWDGMGRTSSYDKAVDDHIKAVLKIPFLDLAALKKRRFKVAYDCVNGAGGVILPGLLEAFGCETFPLNQEPHGRFAHTPEPVPANLSHLGRHVRKTGADIGFAVDPDVDRLAIVAESGEPIGEEYTVTLAIGYVLSKQKGKVVVNLSTTRAVEDVAARSGAVVLRTAVGEIHVAKRMEETGAVIGGEGNGGVILPSVHLGRDAPVAIALTLQHLLEHGGKTSALWRSMPQYAMTKKKIEIGQSNPDSIIRTLGENHKAEKQNWVDGLKIERRDSWVQIRKSNTEPIIRVMSEAKTAGESEELCDLFLREIRETSCF